MSPAPLGVELSSPAPGRAFATALRVAGAAGAAVTHLEIRLDGALAAVVRPSGGRFEKVLETDDAGEGAHVLAVTAFEADERCVSVERTVTCARTPAPRGADDPALRAIAFHRPVTMRDWIAVARARPLFAGHRQPHVPALGFADAARPETFRAQAALAAACGVDAFCVPHDPRAGAPGELPEFPFCLCYDARDAETPAHEARAVLDDALARFADARYVRVEGRPLYLVRRPDLIPHPRETFAAWRATCAGAGAGDPFVLLVQHARDDDPAAFGCDGAVETPGAHAPDVPNAPHGERYDFEELRDAARRRATPAYPLFRCVTTGWDETPLRAERADMVAGASPEGYRRWLGEACAWTSAAHAPPRRLVFLDAWNDWTRGAHLEPDVRFGRLYLEATRDALTAHRGGGGAPAAEPLVSVVVACRDHERYVARALASALDQTLDDLEVIVVDDGSADESVAVVLDLVRERADPRVRVFAQRNLGAHAALNAGLARARGRYVAILNSDDRYLPDRLELMIAALEAQAADFAFSEVAYADAHGRDVTFTEAVPLRFLLKQSEIRSHPDVVHALLDFNVTISTGNFVFRRSLYERIGGFAPLLYCHDWDFALRAARAGKAVYVDRALYEYRFHDANAHACYEALAAYEGRVLMERFFAGAAAAGG